MSYLVLLRISIRCWYLSSICWMSLSICPNLCQGIQRAATARTRERTSRVRPAQFSQEEEEEDDLWPTELLLSESEGGLIMDSSWSMVSACQLESDTNKPGMFPSLFTLRQGPCRVSVLGRQRSVYSLFKRDHTN